jgi:hypothetical protein
MSDYKVWHVSWLCKALEKYREHHNTVKGSMTIEEFINMYLKDDINKIVEMPD